MAFFLTLIFLVVILFLVNSASDSKKGIQGKSIKETLMEPKEVGLLNSSLMWLIIVVGICFIFWMLGLNPT